MQETKMQLASIGLGIKAVTHSLFFLLKNPRQNRD